MEKAVMKVSERNPKSTAIDEERKERWWSFDEWRLSGGVPPLQVRTGDRCRQQADKREARALIHVRLGCFKSAVEDCNLALSLNNQSRKALVLRGQCHSRLEMYHEAVGDFEKALQLKDTSDIQSLLLDAARDLELLR
ncbi:blast:Peptidyl-prolyl cis-trans isomerase FKBP4 [Drosophila guanche]|uniref:Blast:Peptidyl-prolyl cis-trans isomerase FKBP4 n=1 Tax=Drosophila guanche TaxID=7266 RepID=A0A3B0K3Q7_DROGU|nr:blast:Peptidyl-prolyl cis-trans isomerase FKBP4 [Drosophila guanche]